MITQPDYINDFIEDCLTNNPDYFMEYTDEQLILKDILNNVLTESEARIFLLYVYFDKNASKLARYLNAKNRTTKLYVKRVEQKIKDAYADRNTADNSDNITSV